MYKETPIRLSTDFSAGKKGMWHDTFKLMKGKNLQPRILSKTPSGLMEKSKAFQISTS